MKIAFWSNGGENMCVTSNMACITSMISLKNSGMMREILLENHFNRERSLEAVLVQQEKLEFLRETGEYYVKYGLEYILKRIFSGDTYDEIIKNSTINLLLSNMFLLPSGMVFNKEVFNYDFSLVHNELFKLLERVGDYVFIDTESNQNLSTKQILYDADIVAVNLSQDSKSICDFFENYTSLREKAVYIIGKYQTEKRWTRKKICYEYNVPRNKIGVIPYNLEYKDALNHGKVQQFLNYNYTNSSNMENEFFIRQCKKSAKVILDMMNEVRKKNEKQLQKKCMDQICKSGNEKIIFGSNYIKENINSYK